MHNMAAYAAYIPPTKVLPAQKNKTRATKEPALQKMQVQGKSQENGPKAEKDKTEAVTRLGRRTRGDIEKWDQTDSPQIPDKGETSELPASFQQWQQGGGHFSVLF